MSDSITSNNKSGTPSKPLKENRAFTITMFIDGLEYMFLASGNVVIDVRRADGTKEVVASIGAVKTASGMLQAFGRGHYIGHSEVVKPEDWLGADDATVKGSL